MSVSDEGQVSIIANDAERGYNTCGCAQPHKTVTEFVDCVIQRATVGALPTHGRPKNLQLVRVVGDVVEVQSVRTRMPRTEALTHAAWIVALLDDEDTFTEILASIQHRP